MDDSISAAFAHIRKVSKQRYGNVPDLRQQKPKPPVREGKVPKKLGKPTGRDGRALPHRRDFEALDSVLKREITRRGWQRDLAGGWVFNNWPELVGVKIAQHTTVQMLKEKTLFISCDSTAWATQLRVMQRQLLQKISEKTGPNVVEELKIFGPAAPNWRKGPLHVKGKGPRDTYG